MKKILFLLFTFLPLTLSAEEYSGTTGDCTWHLNTDTGILTISGNGYMEDFYYYTPWDVYSSYIKTVIIEDGVKNIGNGAFYNYFSGITSVTIPDGVIYIGEAAFLGCSGLTSITIPESVTYISNYVFYNCTNLTSINLPDNVTYIGDNAFEGCSSLTSIDIPNGITAINTRTFRGCLGLTSITIPDGVTSIGLGAFEGCRNLNSINIPVSVTSIGASAFWHCTTLSSITIPESVTWIGSDAFDACQSLTSISIPEGVTAINNHTFYSCTNLTSVSLPQTITTIDYYAFSGCTSLSSISLPEGVISVGEYAFFQCSKLKSITIPESVMTIGEYAFGACYGLSSVTIPKNVSSIEGNPFAYSYNLNSINIDSSNPYYNDGNGCNCIIETSSNTLLSGCNTTVFPLNVKRIGDFAFTGNRKLTTIEIPKSVTSIGVRAFGSCNGLTSITLPESITSIDEWAFYGCNNLSSVISYITEPFEFGTKAFEQLDDYYGCTLYVPTGTRDAYIAAGWTEEIFKGGIVEIDIVKLSADAAMVYTDEEPTLNIDLERRIDIIMSEFYLHLPDGIEIATDENGNYDVTLNPDRVSDHVLEVVRNSEGAYHFFCYSPTNTPINGTAGELISVNLVHNENVGAGTYPAQLTSILFSDKNLKGISQEPVTVNIQFLPFMPGDANDDTRLNGLDLTEIVNNIMDRPSEQFVKHAVDFDKNDMVNSLDQREELDLLLSQLESDGGNAHETGSGTTGTSAHFSTTFDSVNPLSKAATLSIGLENDGELIMADFYMHLPEGIEIATDDEGGYDVTLNSDLISDHVVEIRKNSDGAYHFICYSPTNNPFISTEGELMSVNFAYDKSEIVGVYDGKLSGILFSDTSLNGVYADDVPFSMEYLDYLMGDVNADLKINAIDVVEMVDNIMERPSVIFVKRAGDFDNNDIINGLDLVAEVNLVLAQMVDDYVKARRLPSFGLEQADNLMRLKVEGESVVMGIDSSDQFILAQYTLHLSDGQTLRDITSDADHVVAYQPVGDNRYTVLCYSMRNNPFITNDKMMTIHVDGEGTVSVTDAMFVNTDRQPCWVGTANTEISTGIIEISGSFCQPVDIYSLNGMVVRKNAVSAEGLDKGIYIINGKKYMKR